MLVKPASLMAVDVRLAVRAKVNDGALSRLHAVPRRVVWAARLVPRWAAHSLTWISAHDDDDRLVGFGNAAWDGGAHAFVLDAVVDHDQRHRGLGVALVRWAAREAAAAGCEWLHVDFEDHLSGVCLDACCFSPTAAGLLRLGNRQS